MSSSDLQALFSTLRPRSVQDRGSPSPALNPTSQQSNTNPVASTESKHELPNPTAQNLLNLLNFGERSQTTAHSQTPPSNPAPSGSKEVNLSAADLVARIMSPRAEVNNTSRNQDAQPVKDGRHTQDSPNVLSNLLSQHASRKSASPVSMPSVSNATQALPSTSTPLAKPSPGVSDSKPLFSYTNPFDALNASRVQTPKAEPSLAHTSIPQAADSESVEFSLPADIAARKKLTPKPRSTRNADSPQPATPPAVRAQETPNQLKDVTETPKGAEGESKSIQQPKQEKEQQKLLSNTDGTNGDEGSGEWEDADEPVPERVVQVYNFPIRAFISITLKLENKSGISIRPESVLEISRFKKDFDQVDRSLACATSKYIGYAFAKHGGLRVIRQADGSDRSVFKTSHDRVFNVTFCTTSTSGPPSTTQSILGTGLSGAVYYSLISDENQDLFEKNDLESGSLVFPAWPQGDDNGAGGLFKTRAKRSSCHPEYFAIGRGRSIHLVWPAIAGSAKYLAGDRDRTVDVEAYYRDRSALIQTGKAGKDFSFSIDDTLIVSLDKTGRLRFWDIRPLVDDPSTLTSKSKPLVVDTPIFTLSAASPSEKMWPTSVLLVDKSRPYVKGGPLRYVLVGLRQNHTLQIWDIALNKAVQELNLPQQTETDAICSIDYHPASGIVVVGHPTRNSIFFVHLSAPKYTLSPSMSQAAYVMRVAAKDSEIANPQSTACFSGIREISLAEKGELRSIELLPIQKISDSLNKSIGSGENPTLFELYIAHSKGVTCLAVNRADLGWDAENKVVHGVDAKQQGLVTVRDFKLGSVVEEHSRSKSPANDVLQPSKSSKKKSKKATQPTEDVVQSIEESQDVLVERMKSSELMPSAATEQAVQEVQKESKKSKKKVQQSIEQSPPKVVPGSVSPVKGLPSMPTSSEQLNVAMKNANGESLAHASTQEIKKVEQTVIAEFHKAFSTLQDNITKDRAALDQSSLGRQEAIIRLVSSSLSTNVEKSLSRIVMDKIQSDVLPALLKVTSDQVSDALNHRLHKVISREINTSLSSTLGPSLDKQVSGSLSDAVARKVSTQIEKQISDSVTKSVVPICQSVAQTAADQSVSAIRSYLATQLQQLQADQDANRTRLEKLNQALQSMATTLQAMSNSQLAFQEQILRDRQSASQSAPNQISTSRTSSSSPAVVRSIPIKAKSQGEIELEEVSALMEQERYEEGTIKWLQSTQPTQLFDEVFIGFTPEYLITDVSPLVAFSVAVTVANALDNNIERRVEWISTAFDVVDPSNPEMTDLSHHAPALIGSIIQKLESLYMTLAERQHDDPVLKSIPALVKKARGLRAAFLAKE